MKFLQLAILLWATVRVKTDSAKAYDEKEALLYLQYARASFCAPSILKQWTCGSICTQASVVPGSVRVVTADATVDVGDINVAFSDAQAYVAQLPGKPGQPFAGKCVVAFRGSVDLLNYYHDFNFVPGNWPSWKNANMSICPSCKAHIGVAQAYEVLRPGVLQKLQELQCKSVGVAGHSLGAGVATLASMELRATGVLVEPVYTFGKLRVGNRAFVDKYVSDATKQGVSPPMWRLVNGHDPVPRLPPHWLEADFIHEPVEVYYPTERRGDYKVCTWSLAVLEDPTCSDSVKVEDCISNPGYDHNNYVGLSTTVEELPPRCMAPDAPVWSI